MRKGIIAAIAAVALFAVGAFAATFNVSTEEVTSGSDSFAACADEVEVDFDTGEYNSEAGDFPVVGATAFFSGEGCNGLDATLVVLDESGNELTSSTGSVDGQSASFELSALVGEVFGSAILVEGFPIPVEGE